MTRDEKIAWMAVWAAKNKLMLVLEGTCGIGRPCVGVMTGSTYPDYEWHDKDWKRIDPNGDVWRPEHSYHKHPCVSVLGHGEEAEAELYEWLQWFDQNGFVLETGMVEDMKGMSLFEVMMGKHEWARMVRKVKT